MKRKRVLVILFVCLAFVGLVTVRAQSGGGYDLTWNTVDGGGMSSGGVYTLGGAIGQPDADVLSGGNYTLTGGFWQSGSIPMPPEYHIYLPLVLRNSS